MVRRGEPVGPAGDVEVVGKTTDKNVDSDGTDSRKAYSLTQKEASDE